MKSYIFEFAEEVSITKLYVNLLERIQHFHGTLAASKYLQFSGKMYRAKLANHTGSFTSICSLQNDQQGDSADFDQNKFYLLNGEAMIQAHPVLDTILGKLDLMYSPRQTYSIQGTSWTTTDDNVLNCATIFSGEEAVNILIQTSNDDELKRIFPDFPLTDSMKLVEIETKKGSCADEQEVTFKNYFDIIIKVAKLNL